MATVSKKLPSMQQALAHLLRRGGATVHYKRGKEVPREKTQLTVGTQKIKAFTEDWNKSALTNLNLPDPVFVKDPSEIIAIDTPLPDRTIGNYDYDIKWSDKNEKKWLVRTELQIGWEEYRREPLTVSLVRCVTETYAEAPTLPPFYHLGRDLLETCGFGPENGFFTTNMMDASNAIKVQMGDETLTSILHIGAWDPSKMFPDLAMFASVELPVEGVAWKNYPEVVGQLMAAASLNYVGKQIDPDDSVSAYALSLSGWSARICHAKFPTNFFEDIAKGQIPSQQPEIKVFPSNRGANLMRFGARRQIMDLIHARAKQRAGDLKLQIRPWGTENE